MKSKLYQISQENYETILKYYISANKKITKYYENITKYKQITQEYCSKIKNIFNDEININSNYETIEIDYDLSNNKDIKESKNKNIPPKEKQKKKIDMSPILNCIDTTNKFFNEYTECIQTFLFDLETPLKSLEAFIKAINSEINSIKDKHNIMQKNYISKYNDFQILNTNLKKIYNSAEESIIKFYKVKKSFNGKNHDLEKITNNFNLSIKEKIQKQDEILEKFNSLGNFGSSYNNYTNEEICSLKLLFSSLFQHFEIFLNNIYIIFKHSFMEPMEKLIESKKDIDNGNESSIKKKFDQILEGYVQKIENKDIENKLDEYKIKITENNEHIRTEIFEKGKLLRRISFEIMNNIDKDLLNEEDIFNIVKIMFNQFKLINQDNYNLKVEEKKLEINKIIEKLIIFADDLNNNKNNNKITKEEVDYLCKYMNDKIYQRYFLIKINNFRSLGVFSIPKEIYDYFIQIFTEISKHLVKEGKDNEKINIDVDNAKLLIILSRTFYCMEDGKKVYIQKKIINNEIYHLIEFWNQLIKYSIENEIKNVSENYLKTGNEDNEENIKERKNKIAFAQILPNIEAMNGFGFKKEEIIKTILPFFDEYEISDKNKQTILQIIESSNNQI